MRIRILKIVLGLAFMLPMASAIAQLETPATELREGQWLEVRGTFSEDMVFHAARVDLVRPDSYQVLIGTVSSQDDESTFNLLGQRVKMQDKTDIGNLPPGSLSGIRVKVEGYYRGPEKFSARKINPRGIGRERISGRIDNIRKQNGPVVITIMNYTVVIPEDIAVEHELAWGDYARSELDVLIVMDMNRDEEDRFGDGYWISDHLQVTGQVQVRGLSEDEYNLNPRAHEDRDDIEASIRARFVYRPSNSFFAVGELNYRYLYRNDEDKNRLSNGTAKLGESFLYWVDPFGNGIDVQIGRVDFDEEREWLYDQKLDTLKAIWTGNRVRAELSYSETLSDGSAIDKAASNGMLYVSNKDTDRHLAAYLIHRDYDLGIPVRRTHYGVRAFGDWLPKQESWLELSLMNGSTGHMNSRAWAVDLGSTWEIHDSFTLTAGWAKGQGGDRNSSTDQTFRQTGLHDNNAKFAGITSFRYYGELVDPELSNLEINTVGLGWIPGNRISLDLVWHSYAQDELSTRLADTDLEQRPNGRHKDIGSEIDLVFGWQASQNLDIEVVAAWFKPGKAFDNADDAFLAKLQLRSRF